MVNGVINYDFSCIEQKFLVNFGPLTGSGGGSARNGSSSSGTVTVVRVFVLLS